MSTDKLKWAAFGLVLGIIGGGIGNAAADKWLPGITRFEIIQAQQIQIVNAAGKSLAILGDMSGDGRLAIFDGAGNALAILGKSPLSDGGVLSLYNDAGENVTMLDAHSGGGVLILNNSVGERAASLEVHKGAGGLVVYESGGFEAGNPAAVLAAAPGGGSLRLNNKAGEVVAVLEENKGTGVIAIRNKDQRVLGLP